MIPATVICGEGAIAPGIANACGGFDDRVASGDNRVGRLFAVGCTAWGITNGAFLTAGHCADFDPDLSSVQWRYDGDGQGLGKDWCVFRVNRNSNTLLLPWATRGVRASGTS